MDAGQDDQVDALSAQSVLFVGGEPRVLGRRDPDAIRRIVETMGRLLQVKNLAVLIGAGASMHLGSPRIRNLSVDEVLEMVKVESNPVPERTEDLIRRTCPDGSVDLEALLATLSLGIAFARSTGSGDVHIGGSAVPLEAVSETRRLVNLSLARSCDLPNMERADAAHREDPLRVHREFFRKLLRSRRGDLPRVRLFTTNYDLLIEQTLDDSGIPYFDGFLGTVTRVFRPEVFEQDIYLPPGPDERRLTRLPEVMYLYKLHGSINWRSSASGAGLGADVVTQSYRSPGGSEELALIYPTPQKEGDVLGYPYSELFRDLTVTVGTSETALLVIGYGFSDEHINRFIFQALAAVPTFQLFVVDPSAATLEASAAVEAGAGATDPASNNDSEVKFAASLAGRLAQFDDARVSVLAGPLARFENVASVVMPDPDALMEEEAKPPLPARLSALLEGGGDEPDTG